ncbi:acetyltransferase [Pseudoalteromonas sp. SCSIO 43210]|uniref:acetyltransferase n=1 Tax=Pseudoalteromonas TaxID=53246 RepID=UPI000AFFF900|nr:MULTISPECIES: acetyltransferase [Pseudoalteromonas]
MDDGSGQILAYFSLSIKEVSLNQNNETKISKGLRKKLDGICKNSERVNAYLIGQIGKNDSVANNQINLSYILEEAYTIIDKANQLVGGRVIILECEKAERLVALYQKNGFNILIDNPAERLITMYICVR